MKRIACAHENCGTFPMDDALYRKLQQTGESFTCPEGHPQSFTDSTHAKLKDARKQIERLKGRIENFKDYERRSWDKYLEEHDRRTHLETMLLSEKNGVIEVGPGEFKWSCPCGSRGRKAFETAEVAHAALADHHRRTECVGSCGLGRAVL